MTRDNDEDAPDDDLSALRGRVAALEAEITKCRAAEAELRAMFQAMTDVVLVMNHEGRYLKIGPTAPDLLYKPSAELVGKTMHEVMPAAAADFFLSHIRQALESGRVVTMDYSLPISGREIWFSANISPMSEDTVILVARDVSERKRAEEVLQASLRQQEVIRAQEAALAQLSTPLIPISDEIVVMPLIGLLDGQRMQRVLDTLLEGIQQSGARFAILDITGISVVDTQVAESLVRAARAVQLLGSKVVLTGIRPEVAQTLVTLETNLGGMATLATLQSGIAYAMSTAR